MIFLVACERKENSRKKNHQTAFITRTNYYNVDVRVADGIDSSGMVFNKRY